MVINKKIVYVRKKEEFEPLIATIPEGLNPVVFIEDTREMWTCGTYFSIGYPSIEVSEISGSVKVQIGNSFFLLTPTGDSISLRKGDGNRIIINSNALNRVDTEPPLKWDTSNRKVLHMESGVTSGSYGQSTNLGNASVFVVPNFIVDATGHITFAENHNIEIRDYVEQVAPSNQMAERNVLLSYNEANNNIDTSQVRKANGLTFNDATQRITVAGGMTSDGAVTVNHGDVSVLDGYIVGKLKGDVEGQATPKIHLSLKPEYGGASTKLYGHVKLQDILSRKPDPSSDNENINDTNVVAAIAASPLMVWNAIETAKSYADSILGSNNAMLFKGALEAGISSPGTYTPMADVGNTYVVTFGNGAYRDSVGYINGVSVEVGDLLICKEATAASDGTNWEEVSKKWTYVQTNTTGVVSGPSSATIGQLAVFDSITGKLIKGLPNGSVGQMLVIGESGIPAWANKPDRLNYALSFQVKGVEFTSFDGYEAKKVNFIAGDNMFITPDSQGNLTLAADPGSDTVNTAGATNLVNEKLFLIGAESQTTSPQTYSNQYVYIGTDNCLYSLGKKVLTEHQAIYNLDLQTQVGDTVTKVTTFDPNAANNSFTLVQGTNVTLTPDTTNKKVTISSRDTRNTTGATEKLATKLFLTGASAQTDSPQTYTNSKVYIGTDNKLYSDDKVVSTGDHTHNYAGATSPGGPALKVDLNPSGLLDATYGSYGGILQDSNKGPVSGSWSNRIKILHNNSTGYYTELAQNFTGTAGLWHRRNVTGTVSEWIPVIDKANFRTYLDDTYVNRTGDTMTGTLTSASTTGSIVFKGSESNDITNMYTTNGTIEGSFVSIRNGLRFNWYNTYWYIGNIRGSSTDSNGFGIANESNKLYLQVTPNNTIAPVFRSTVATGKAPFIVSSSTVVNNLNADLLDGVHLAGFSGREGVMRSWLRGRYTTVNQYFGNGNVVTLDPKPTDDSTLSANTTIFSLGDTPTRNTQLAFYYDSDTIKYRRHDDSRWNSWVTLLHSGNYAGFLDSRYINVSGDTMTGTLGMGANTIYWKENGFGDKFGLTPYFSGTDNSNYLAFMSSVGGAGTDPAMSAKMVLTGLGNVGIGTTAPTQKLHVIGGGLFTALLTSTGITNNGTLTQNGDIIINQASTTGTRQVRFQGEDNDYGRVAFGGTASNAGWMEIASADDGNEPIYVRQYTGVFTSIKRTATLLDANGNTVFPGTVTAPTFTGALNGTAEWSKRLAANSQLTFGLNGLTYFNAELSAGTAANQNVGPTAQWWHILRMNHGNSSGYFADIAVPLNTSDGIYWRRIQGGTNYGWYRVLDTNNYAGIIDGRYVNVTGDTMTGALHLANGTRNNAGDDCGFGDCNIGGCLGLQGLNGATGLAFIKQGTSWSGGNNYRFTWNGSNMVSNSTAQWNNLNADLLDGLHQNSFLRTNGANQHVTLTGGNGNNPGWRLVYDHTGFPGWSINSMTLAVISRHSGTGILTIIFHTTNSDSTSYVGKISYYGGDSSLDTSSWRMFYNTSTKRLRIYWKYTDYNSCSVIILNYTNLMTNISNGTWYTSLPSDNGNEIPSEYNRASSAYRADTLSTARTINGTSFNGTSNITTSYWGTARNITIGNTTRSVNGSANVSWSLADIGGAPASHSHNYINSRGNLNPQTGRTQNLGDVYSYNTVSGTSNGAPTTYTSVIGFGRGAAGTVEIAGSWTGGMGLWYRALRDTTDNWYGWVKVWDTKNFDPNSKANSNHNHDSVYVKQSAMSDYMKKSEVGDWIISTGKSTAITVTVNSSSGNAASMGISSQKSRWRVWNSGMIEKWIKIVCNGNFKTDGWITVFHDQFGGAWTADVATCTTELINTNASNASPTGALSMGYYNNYNSNITFITDGIDANKVKAVNIYLVCRIT